MKYLFLFIVCPIAVINSWTYEEIKDRNGIFNQWVSCRDRVSLCYCNSDCNLKGDCCLKYETYSEMSMVEAANYVCRKVSLPKPKSKYIQNVYMREKCMEGWTSKLELEKCTQSNGKIEDVITIGNDPELDIPVTSMSTNVTYKNRYCAVCNNELVKDLELWKVEVDCNFNFDADFIRKNMKFENQLWVWNADVTSESWQSCRLKAVIPETLNSKVRRCLDNIEECKNRTNLELCQSYTAYVYLSYLSDTYHQNNYSCNSCNVNDADKFAINTYEKIEAAVSIFKDCAYHVKNCLSYGNCSKTTECLEDGCRCDDKCIEFGDCCIEAKAYDLNKMIDSTDKLECVDVVGYGSIYMRKNCLPSSAHEELCHMGSSAETVNIPVTSTTTNITYKNIDCGLCNEESPIDLQHWQVIVKCVPSPGKPLEYLDEFYIRENLQFEDGEWGVFSKETEGSKFLPCFLEDIPGDNLVDEIRRCNPLVSSCSPMWTDQHVVRLCKSYIKEVSVNNIFYRNYHCAICNFVKENEIKCFGGGFGGGGFVGVGFGGGGGFTPASFTVLMDVSDITKAKERKKSPLFKKPKSQ